MVEKNTIAILKFKAHCLQVLRRVKRTGKPGVVTHFGEPIAEIVPPAQDGSRRSWLGTARVTARMHDDLIEPAFQPEDCTSSHW